MSVLLLIDGLEDSDAEDRLVWKHFLSKACFISLLVASIQSKEGQRLFSKSIWYMVIRARVCYFYVGIGAGAVLAKPTLQKFCSTEQCLHFMWAAL